jgi:hypothetical protein
MTRERHLGRAVEDADARGVGRVLRRQDKGGLRVVELGGQRLHVGVRDPPRVGHDGERIAAEAAVGEDVQGLEGEGRHGLTPLALRAVSQRLASLPSH